jgi:hypothetical protein
VHIKKVETNAASLEIQTADLSAKFDLRPLLKRGKERGKEREKEREKEKEKEKKNKEYLRQANRDFTFRWRRKHPVSYSIHLVDR